MSKNHFIARSALTTLVLAACAHGAFAQITLPACSGTLLRFSVCEIVLTTASTYINDYTDTSVTATFTQAGGVTKTVTGFWDGDLPDGRGVFRIRFNASNAGSLSYTTRSTDLGLNGRSGSFTVSSTLGARGFVRRNSTNAEKFVFDNGTRYFMWGQTYYQIVTNARMSGNWRQSIDNSASYSMNKVRILLSPFGSFPPYGGSQPFTNSAHDSLDLTHWQKFDEVVNYLNQKPMVADVILFSTNPISYAPDPVMDQKYVRYALARLAAFPNVIWCLTNEWQASPYGDDPSGKGRSYWNTIGGIVRSEDPWMDQGGNQRALSIHQSTDPLFEFFGSTWPTYAVLQYGTHQSANPLPDDWGNFSIRNNNLMSNNNHGNDMPVVNDEYLYLCDPLPACPAGQVFDQVAHRQAIWGIATAGGYGSAGDLRLINGQHPTISADWKDEPEYADISRLVDFFVNRVSTWWRMTTQNALVTSGARVYVLAESGVRYVVYSATGGTFTLNLPAPSGASSYRVFRFDPSTGSEAQLSNVRGGLQTFTMPQHSVPNTGNDWVLRIEV